MSNYRRLISYMYAYEGQVKGKNIGFAKLELRNTQCKIQVSVKKVYESGNDVGVYLLADDTEVLIGKIYIRNGNGEFRTSVYAENVEMSGFSMSQIYGLTIHDMKNPWVSYTTIWEDAVTQAAQVDLEYVTSENCKHEKTQEEKTKEILQQIEDEVEEQERQKEKQQREEKEAKEMRTWIESSKENGIQDTERMMEQITERMIEQIIEVDGTEDEAEEIREIERLDEIAEIKDIEDIEEIQEIREMEEVEQMEGIEGLREIKEIKGIERIEGERIEIIGEIEREGIEAKKEEVADVTKPKKKKESLYEPASFSWAERSGEQLWECEPQFIRQRIREPGRSRRKDAVRTEQKQEFFRNGSGNSDIRREVNSKSTNLENRKSEQMVDRDTRRSSWLSVPFSASKSNMGEGAKRTVDTLDSGNRESRLSGWTTGLFGKRKGEDTVGADEKKISQISPQASEVDLARQVTFRLFDEKFVPSPDRNEAGKYGFSSDISEPNLSNVPKTLSMGTQKLDAPELGQMAEKETARKTAPTVNSLKFIQNAEKLEKFDEEEQQEFERTQKLWEELKGIYPKMQEFDYETGCEILAIKPKDIGLLPRENWIYGNNSFLLHGYYNYRYLILVQLTEQKGEHRYLLGVPGHYYNNDKYMASMFGFPGFVLSKRQPTEDGRFGYWYTNIKMEMEEI